MKVKAQRDSSSDEAKFDDELAGDDKKNIENMGESLPIKSMNDKGKLIAENIQTQPHLKE